MNKGATRTPKRYYPLERQIEDCLRFLGEPIPAIDEMGEDEIASIENELGDQFEWVEHTDYAQYVPKHKQSGTLILGG